MNLFLISSTSGVVGSATPPWILRQQALLKQEQEEHYNQLYSQSGQPVNSAASTSQDNNQSQLSNEDKTNDRGSPLLKLVVHFYSEVSASLHR